MAPGLDIVMSPDADTLAYIDPPSYKPTWSVQPNSVETVAHRINSRRLLDINSPVFLKLLEPRTQARIAKRRGPPPPGFRYIIDLTPPSAEEDAVLFLTELSCPLAIRKWADSQGRWDLPVPCVGGEDEPKLLDSRARSEDLPEYSDSRHRMGIVHILMVIDGMTPPLDTPCKLWTFFGLAKIYEIATHPQISVPILSWIYESSNKRLIELNPEISYRIARGTQCSHLCRDAFSVLVGEEALLLLHNTINGTVPRRQQKTLHGRSREIMDDEELQRIEYASKSFMDFVIERFVELVSVEMRWLSRLSTFQTILLYNPRSVEERFVVSELISCLKDYVRSRIVASLDTASLTWLPNRYVLDGNIYPTQKFLNVYSSLSCIERIMSRTFWTHLGTLGFSEGDQEIYLQRRFWSTSIADLGNPLPGFRDQQDAIIRPVLANELNAIVKKFNALGYQSPVEAQQTPGALDDAPTCSTLNVLGGPLRRQNGFVIHARPIHEDFNLRDFFTEVKSFITSYADGMTEPIRSAMTYGVTDTLTCLREEEFKYLPLWAGGNDDGTGGVFMDQDIPLMEAGGFSAPGPSIHTGSTASTSSSFTVVSNSTVHGASHRATEGYDSEVVSINSDVMLKGESVENNHDPTFANDDKMSLDLSSADEVTDFWLDSDSDSDDTILADQQDQQEDDLDGFEELNLEDDSFSRSPSQERASH